jgi:hypothetical protein
MSSFNTSTKTGYTRSGKSLKAIRRYYAQLNQKGRRSPDEDKLSRRVAAELKTQQDANEKRSRREVGQTYMGSEQVTARSELPPLLVSAKESGPVFIAPPPQPPAPPQPPQPPQPPTGLTAQTQPYPTGPQYQPTAQPVGQSKSVQQEQYYKSYKSARSLGATQTGAGSRFCNSNYLYFIFGLVLGIAIGALGYMVITKLKRHEGEYPTATTTTARPTTIGHTVRPTKRITTPLTPEGKWWLPWRSGSF